MKALSQSSANVVEDWSWSQHERTNTRQQLVVSRSRL